MEKYAILLGYFDKQRALVQRLHREIVGVDVTVYEQRFVFALKTQQFYTALEDLFKQIAKAFENHIDALGSFHKELLARMNTEVPKVRPQVLSQESLLLLDKIRAFRHFIRHAYDVELNPAELRSIQEKLKGEFRQVERDLERFRAYLLNVLSV